MTENFNINTNNIIEISTEYIKLDSFLKFCGAVMTGGEAKLLIAGGKVSVDGEVCLMRGKKLRPGMSVDIALNNINKSYLVRGL